MLTGWYSVNITLSPHFGNNWPYHYNNTIKVILCESCLACSLITFPHRIIVFVATIMMENISPLMTIVVTVLEVYNSVE